MRSQSPPGPANPRPFLSQHTFRQDPLTNSIDRHRAIGHPPPHPAKTSATEDSSRQVITHPARNISCHRTGTPASDTSDEKPTGQLRTDNGKHLRVTAGSYRVRVSFHPSGPVAGRNAP